MTGDIELTERISSYPYFRAKTLHLSSLLRTRFQGRREDGIESPYHLAEWHDSIQHNCIIIPAGAVDCSRFVQVLLVKVVPVQVFENVPAEMPSRKLPLASATPS